MAKSRRRQVSPSRKKKSAPVRRAPPPALTTAPAEPPSLARALRESLGLPGEEGGADAPNETVQAEEAPVPSEPERPPMVKVVSVGSFVPTGHLVCEGCGRIVRWTIPEGPRKELAEAAITSPEGWDVRSLAVSFTGFCPNCRRAEKDRGPAL